MIVSRTPFRISFFGGGTDYPAWFRDHGGTVLSTTINKYCYLTTRYLPPFFEHRIRVVLQGACCLPVAFLHGAEDIDSGPEVYVALRDLDVPVAYVTYPREGHGISEPMHQRDLLRRNQEWFRKWVLGR